MMFIIGILIGPGLASLLCSYMILVKKNPSRLKKYLKIQPISNY